MVRSPMVSRRSWQWPTCTPASVLAFLLSASCANVALAQQPGGSTSPAQTSPSGLGRAPTAAELRAWDLSIGPDGAELPPGKGTPAQGALVFTQRGCAACHGPTGIEGPGPVLIGGTATLASNYFPIRYWPFAPSIWDYIMRAMPYDKPGYLTSDEVYALTAFLLFKNSIIREDEVMDAQMLPKVAMPYRANYKGPSPATWTPHTSRGFTILP